MLENLLTLLPINCNKKKGVITHTKAAIVIETYALHTFIDIETYALHRNVTQLAKNKEAHSTPQIKKVVLSLSPINIVLFSNKPKTKFFNCTSS